MTKRRILFVDDEPHVLDGLRNILRKQRHVWDMTFALGGRAALDELAKMPADVIVSDMRMPGMDGAELLKLVKELYPQTVRIVLSGHAERDAIARVIAVAHQFLSKPSDAETVRSAVERTCRYQELVLDERIRRVVGGMDSLPSLPSAYWEVTRATASPDTTLADITRLIESDPAMSIKVLQIVNSAFFGLPQVTESVAKAVSYLGIENLKGVLVAAHLFSTDEGVPTTEGFSMERLRSEAILTATLARELIRDPKLADAAFTAGIIHDIGQLILERDPSTRYGDVLRRAREAGEPLHVVEQRELGVTHGMVGGYLIGVWGLPFSLAEAVAFHEAPSAVPEGNVDVLAAVYLADALLGALTAGRDPLAEGRLDLAFLGRARLADDLPKWRALAEQAVRRSAAG